MQGRMLGIMHVIEATPTSATTTGATGVPTTVMELSGCASSVAHLGLGLAGVLVCAAMSPGKAVSGCWGGVYEEERMSMVAGWWMCMWGWIGGGAGRENGVGRGVKARSGGG